MTDAISLWFSIIHVVAVLVLVASLALDNRWLTLSYRYAML